MSTIITASYTVTPNKLTPNVSIRLSETDQIAGWSYTMTIYIYKDYKESYSLERMRDSLSKILVHYYPVAGRLSRIEGGRLQLNCNAKGVTLLEAQSSKTMDEFGDFAPSETLNKDLVPSVVYGEEEFPLLLVQLTRFRGHEEINQQGLAVGVAISHCLVDGLGAIPFINSWAKLCRGEELDSDEMFPFLDRTVLHNSTPREPRYDHIEMKPVQLLQGSNDSSADQKKNKIAAFLKLTTEQIEKLRKKAPQKEGSKPYSRFEVIGGHIWKCICKSHELDENQPTKIRIIADIRNRLNPPLPRNYFGNAVTVALTPMCHVGKLTSHTLSFGAQKIREASDLVTDEYIRSQLDFLRCQEQLVDWIRATFSEDPYFQFLSWMRMPVYEADFGWGKPVHFGPSKIMSSTGMTYLIQSSNGDGSILVLIYLEIQHMEFFKKLFYEDI